MTRQAVEDARHGGDNPIGGLDEETTRFMFCNDMDNGQAEVFLDKLGPDQWPTACYSQSEWRHDHLRDIPVSYVLCLTDAILPLEWQEHFARNVHARSTPRIDAGHQVMNTRPQALAEVLLAESAA